MREIEKKSKFKYSDTLFFQEIEPFQTKTVINAKILGAHERNGTGFLKIKTGLKKNEKDGVFKSSSVEKFEENLIVPFEVCFRISLLLMTQKYIIHSFLNNFFINLI